MEIRQATVDDFELLKDLKLKAKASERRHNKSLRTIAATRERYFGYLKNDLASKDRAVFMALEEGTPVGIVTGRVHRTLLIQKARKKGHISNLFVASGHRKKGIATALLESLVKWFHDKSVTDLRLGVYVKNTVARDLFLRLGFREYAIEMKKRS